MYGLSTQPGLWYTQNLGPKPLLWPWKPGPRDRGTWNSCLVVLFALLWFDWCFRILVYVTSSILKLHNCRYGYPLIWPPLLHPLTQRTNPIGLSSQFESFSRNFLDSPTQTTRHSNLPARPKHACPRFSSTQQMLMCDGPVSVCTINIPALSRINNHFSLRTSSLHILQSHKRPVVTFLHRLSYLPL